jgi:hypothetical protein
LPVEKKVKGSTLGWYVGRKFISYLKIKKNTNMNKLQRDISYGDEAKDFVINY